MWTYKLYLGPTECVDLIGQPEGVYMPIRDSHTVVNKLGVFGSVQRDLICISVRIYGVSRCVCRWTAAVVPMAKSIRLFLSQPSCSSTYLTDKSSLTLHHSQTEPLKEAN